MSLTSFPFVQCSAQQWFLAHYQEIRSRTRACSAYMRAEEREETIAEVIGTVFKAGVYAARRRRSALAGIEGDAHGVVLAFMTHKAGSS